MSGVGSPAGSPPGTPFDLRDADQAKEFLDNIGTEYRFQCYHENLPDGCHRLADYFEAFKKEFDKALVVFERNCIDNKFGHSCFKAGNYNMIGRTVEKSNDKAYDFYAKGCDAGYGAACHNAGLLQRSGRLEGEPDYAKSVDLLQKGCDQNNVPSCQYLSTLYIKGNTVGKDMKKAFELATKACQGEHIYACVNLSQMYARGEGVEKNEEKAKMLRKRAEDLRDNQVNPEEQLKFGQ